MSSEIPSNPSNEWLTNGVFYDNKYVLDHIKLPDNIEDMPNIIGLSCPSRSGSSAMLFLLASQEGIDRAYFQPEKSLIRHGNPDYVFHGTDDLVFVKEVFGMLYPEELYDPIGTLLAAGVPPEKITWITTLRNPVDAYASWNDIVSGPSPELYALAQAHTLNLYKKYRDTVTCIPFAYDLLQEGVSKVLTAVLAKTALSGCAIDLSFDNERLAERVEWGEASDPVLYEHALAAIVARGKFSYMPSRKSISEEDREKIIQANMADYVDFYQHSRDVLGI